MVFHDKPYQPKIGLHTTTETDSAAKYMYMYIIDTMYRDKFFPPVTVFYMYMSRDFFEYFFFKICSRSSSLV